MFLTVMNVEGVETTINVALISHFYPGYEIKWKGALRESTFVFVNGHELLLVISSKDLAHELSRFKR